MNSEYGISNCSNIYSSFGLVELLPILTMFLKCSLGKSNSNSFTWGNPSNNSESYFVDDDLTFEEDELIWSSSSDIIASKSPSSSNFCIRSGVILSILYKVFSVCAYLLVDSILR